MSIFLLASCEREEEVVAGEAPQSHEDFARQLEQSGLSRTAMGQRWLESAKDALTEPLEIVLPYAENGGFLAHRAAALGLIFEAFDGQTLHLEFSRQGDARTGRVFVELFQVREPLAAARHVRLRGLGPDDVSMELRLPHDGRYLLRLQPELLVDALYSLRLELDAAIPFPAAIDTDAVGSFFGDPRDAGARQHEGIDIFAPRHTPVLAVAAGRAIPRSTQRGGEVVWLRAANRSYYYAHLEQAAFATPREVEAGDVLGYVGNSGNAITTPTHLHFGVYQRGYGAIDPLPRLATRRFEETPSAAVFSPRHVRTRAAQLNLRAAPSTAGAVLGQLEQGSVLEATAARGEWLRVVTPANVVGWIHGDYQYDALAQDASAQAPAAPGHWRTSAPVLLLDSLVGASRPVARVDAGSELDVIGRYGTHLLVTKGGTETGWLAGPLRDDLPSAAAVAADAEAGAGTSDDESLDTVPVPGS